MKFINRAMALAVVLTLSAVSAWAQTQQCTEDYLNETYTKWWEPYKARDTDPKQKDLAYQIAKEYVNKCPSEFADNAYAKALKSYVQVYEKAQASGQLEADFDAAVKARKYAEQLRLGKQLVAMPSHADNAVIYLLMANAGLGDPNLLSESAPAAKKAIELLEAGKSFDKSGYQTKDLALAQMNYLLAKSTMKTSPTDAIPFFIKAAKYQTDLQKSPLVYNELAAAYGDGPVSKLTEDYKKFIGQPESNESKLVLANLNQAIDRQIDALARATALADAANKPPLKERLTELYEFRNKTKEGVDQLVAGVLNKPLPEPPTPITTLPAASAGASGAQPASPAPTGSAVGNPASGNSGSGSATSPTTKPAPSTGAPTTPAKPTATPKPKPRRANHRRGH